MLFEPRFSFLFLDPPAISYVSPEREEYRREMTLYYSAMQLEIHHPAYIGQNREATSLSLHRRRYILLVWGQMMGQCIDAKPKIILVHRKLISQ